MAKLLIVDDEKNIRLSLATLFQKHHVQTAARAARLWKFSPQTTSTWC